MTAIAAGMVHNLALKSDGTVAAWGMNSLGQVGDGTATNRLTPVPVSGLTGVTAVAAGTSYSLALKSDGSVWAWGNNEYGQLGDGTATNRLTPVAVSGLTGIVGIAGSGGAAMRFRPTAAYGSGATTSPESWVLATT